MKDIVMRLGLVLSEDDDGCLFERNGQVYRLTNTLLLRRQAVPHVFVPVDDPELEREVMEAVAAERTAH